MVLFQLAIEISTISAMHNLFLAISGISTITDKEIKSN